jgi:hypothetical protein
MQDADRASEQAEHAYDGQPAENREDEGLGHIARDHGKRDGSDGKGKRKHNDKTDIALAAGLIGGGLGVTRWGVDVGHGVTLPDSISVRAALYGVAHGCSLSVQIHDGPGHFAFELSRAKGPGGDPRTGRPPVILAPWLADY